MAFRSKHHSNSLNHIDTHSRLLSLDIFRGITIFLMILVNSPGNNTAYTWLSHAAWDGCTLADIVFPFFLFIMGVSIVFSLSSARANSISSRALFFKIVRRSLILILLGLFLNAFPYHFDFSSLRFYGVLQRIAICYLVTSILFLTTTPITQTLLLAFLLVGYWMLMMIFPLESSNHYGFDGNLVGAVDRLIFSAPHLYENTFDPEGFLSTLPAIATTLLGTLTGYCLYASSYSYLKLVKLLMAGLFSLFLGWVWGLYFPINKALWSSSYVLWTGGLALLLLAALYGCVEIKKWQKGLKPFKAIGMNAIAAYFFSILLMKIQAMIKITQPDSSLVNLRLWLTDHLFSWTSAQSTSLLYALSYAFMWLAFFTFLYQRKIFIKV